MPFAPGVSGNPGGRRAEKPYRDALRKILAELVTDADPKEPRTKLEAVARSHVAAALDRDVRAIEGIADRLDGKVPQALVGDDEADPIRVVNKIVREIVRPKPQNPNG